MIRDNYPYYFTITTYNRLPFLKRCLESFLATVSHPAIWHIIIADDGSSDGTLAYIKRLSLVHPIHLIKNKRVGVHNQKNLILQFLSKTAFQVAFIADDDIFFKQKNWDGLYLNQITQTTFKHLVYYDMKWNPSHNLKNPIRSGPLICHTQPTTLQGALFTITPEVIHEVGYFDVEQFGFKGLGHLDYSLRCCRAGFNDPFSPFDVAHSNDYIELQKENYVRSVPLSFDRRINPPEVVERKVALLSREERKYIAFHTIKFDLDEPTEYILIKGHKWRLADSRFYSRNGISGILGTSLKRIYNFSLILGCTNFPILIKKLGKKIGGALGKHLEFIDQ